MKASGMSAKQMDSNAELKLWIATATDPEKSIQANREAMDRIENLYGSGGAGKHPPVNPPPSKAPRKITGDADYNSLKSGEEFIGPDGVKRRKP